MSYKTIMGIVPTMSATALLSENLKVVKKKKKKSENFVKLGMTNLIGIPLIQTQAQLIGSL